MAEPAADGCIEAEPPQAPAARHPSAQTGAWFLPPPSAAGNHVPEVSQLELVCCPLALATLSSFQLFMTHHRLVIIPELTARSQ